MSNKALANELLRLFVHRNDVYGKQLENGNYKGNIKKPITRKLIQQHLDGKITIGVYNLDKDNTVKYLAFDIDNHEDDKEYTDWKKLSSKILKHLHRKYGLTTVFERSGSPNSVHLWIFLKPTNAKKVREFGQHVLKELKIKNVEIFPKNDELEDGEIGNLIKLPSGVHRKNGRRSKFLFPDPKYPFSKHAEYRDKYTLNRLSAIKPQKLPEIPSNKLLDTGKTKTTDRKKSNKPPLTDRKKLRDSVKSELESKLRNCKTCIQIVYNTGMQLDGEEGHNFRLAICRDLIAKKLSDYQIHEFFKRQFDYKYAVTQKNIIEVRKSIQKYNMKHGEKIRYSRCDTMKEKCGTVIKPLCDLCEIKREINSNINQGKSIIPILKIEKRNFIRESWQAIKQIGEMSSGGEFLHIHSDEISQRLPENINVDEFLEILKDNKLIEKSRILYKGKRSRIIKIDVKAIEEMIK